MSRSICSVFYMPLPEDASAEEAFSCFDQCLVIIGSKVLESGTYSDNTKILYVFLYTNKTRARRLIDRVNKKLGLDFRFMKYDS